MARKASWLTLWEQTHTADAAAVLRLLTVQGAGRDKLLLEFGIDEKDPDDLRSFKRWLGTHGRRLPRKKMELTPEESARRSEAAKRLPHYTTHSLITYEGESLARNKWCERYGGSIKRYYDKDEAAVLAYIEERRNICEANGGAKPAPRKRQGHGEQKRLIHSVLPYARQAVQGTSPEDLRKRVRAELMVLRATEGELDNDNQQEEGDTAGV